MNQKELVSERDAILKEMEVVRNRHKKLYREKLEIDQMIREERK